MNGNEAVDSFREPTTVTITHHLSPGAKAVFVIWGGAWTWDVICWLNRKELRNQTISEVVARGLLDRRTVIPVTFAIFINVAHVYALARYLKAKEEQRTVSKFVAKLATLK